MVHALLYLLGHVVEEALDVLACFCAGFEEFDAQLCCQSLPLIMGDLPIVDIRLVSYQHLRNVIRGMHLDLFHPILNILETLSLIYRIGKHNPHRPSVVSLRDGFKLLLPRRIPNLQAYLILTNSDSLDLEVNANGGKMRCHEIILAKLEQHVGLTHSAIADH